MKAFITNLLKFGCLAALIYLAFLVVFVKFVPKGIRKNAPYIVNSGFVHTRLKNVKQVKDIDVLVIGSSRAYRGYDTRVINKYGYSAFNLGSNGQSPIQTELLLKRYLDQLNPKLVILDIYPAFFEADGLESAVDLAANDVFDIHLWEMLRSYNNIKLYNVFLYSQIIKAIGADKQADKDPSKGRHAGKDIYIPGGFVETNVEYKDAGNDYPRKRLTFNQKQLVAFRNVTDLLKKRNIDFVIVQSPVIEKLYASFENADEVDSMAASNGLYYNFNKLYPQLQDVSYFYDDSHLNNKGALAFTNEVVPLLLKKSISKHDHMR